MKDGPESSVDPESGVPSATKVNGAIGAPWPGSKRMPRWNSGSLPTPPRFTLRNWFALLGPGLLMGGASIGGGEWLMGPAVTARYGGALMWLATMSILAQVLYNIEISRYTLYTGEPIFTGKFRTLPGPRFWLCAYLLLDFGAVFPYLAANAATPLAAILLGGELPDPNNDMHRWLLRILGYLIFLLALVPLVAGGKIYNALKGVMTFKMVTVLGFLLALALFHSDAATWREIFVGFFQFGTLPSGGSETVSIFRSLFSGNGLPQLDLSVVPLLAAFAAIAGSGGLSNAAVSNYTRDQGWGMGQHVGAIPSVIGGHNISLSHVGTVFSVSAESMQRWRHWLHYVKRDQWVIWVPACFLGVALPSMLSVQFLPRGTEASDWVAAGMTSDGVRQHVSAAWGLGSGELVWYLTMLCGFLVLGPTMATHADGVIRRWVDVVWTSSSRLRRLDPRNIRWLYFGVLAGYATFGLIMLSAAPPLQLLKIAANLFNFSLGFSCFHTLVINTTLLPPELRPGWGARLGLALGGLFFMLLAVITTLQFLGFFDPVTS